eukprot:SM000089S23810  [mRNA]  locus=s89:116005:123618:+ [translate_table: standard]
MAALTAYELQRQARLAATRARLLQLGLLLAASPPPPPPRPAAAPSFLLSQTPPAAGASGRAPLPRAAARRSSSRLAGARKDYHEPSAGVALPRQARPVLASSGERRLQEPLPGECKPQLYTREHLRLLDSADHPWHLKKDGLAPPWCAAIWHIASRQQVLPGQHVVQSAASCIEALPPTTQERFGGELVINAGVTQDETPEDDSSSSPALTMKGSLPTASSRHHAATDQVVSKHVLLHQQKYYIYIGKSIGSQERDKDMVDVVKRILARSAMAPLTAYELQRQASHAANRARLLELGLIATASPLPPPAAAPSSLRRLRRLPPAASRRAQLPRAVARRSTSRSGERRREKLQAGECKPELYTREHQQLKKDGFAPDSAQLSRSSLDNIKSSVAPKDLSAHTTQLLMAVAYDGLRNAKDAGPTDHLFRCKSFRGQVCDKVRMCLRNRRTRIGCAQSAKHLQLQLLQVAQGLGPHGQLYRKVVAEGYTSVAHYLVLTQQECRAEESISSESGVTQDETPEDSSSSSPDLAVPAQRGRAGWLQELLAANGS